MTLTPDCPICLEPGADLCLPCGGWHWIHRSCWSKCLDASSCPLCRQSLVSTIWTPKSMVLHYTDDLVDIISDEPCITDLMIRTWITKIVTTVCLSPNDTIQFKSEFASELRTAIHQIIKLNSNLEKNILIMSIIAQVLIWTHESPSHVAFYYFIPIYYRIFRAEPLTKKQHARVLEFYDKYHESDVSAPPLLEDSDPKTTFKRVLQQLTSYVLQYPSKARLCRKCITLLPVTAFDKNKRHCRSCQSLKIAS